MCKGRVARADSGGGEEAGGPGGTLNWVRRDVDSERPALAAVCREDLGWKREGDMAPRASRQRGDAESQM